MIKMLWSMVSKAAEIKKQRHDTFCDPTALIRCECTAEQFQWNDVYSRQNGYGED